MRESLLSFDLPDQEREPCSAIDKRFYEVYKMVKTKINSMSYSYFTNLDEDIHYLCMETYSAFGNIDPAKKWPKNDKETLALIEDILSKRRHEYSWTTKRCYSKLEAIIKDVAEGRLLTDRSVETVQKHAHKNINHLILNNRSLTQGSKSLFRSRIVIILLKATIVLKNTQSILRGDLWQERKRQLDQLDSCLNGGRDIAAYPPHTDKGIFGLIVSHYDNGTRGNIFTRKYDQYLRDLGQLIREVQQNS